MPMLGGKRRQEQIVSLVAGSCSNALRFFSFYDDTETGVIDRIREFAPGRAFRLLGYGVKCQLDPGSTMLGIHRNGSGTPEETITVDPGAAATWIRKTTAIDFAANDRLAFGITATDYPADVNAYIHVLWLE